MTNKITRTGFCHLLSVEKRNPDISDHEFAWRRGFIGIAGRLHVLEFDGQPDETKNAIFVDCGSSHYNTSGGKITTEINPDGTEILTITTKNTAWTFHFLPDMQLELAH